jgi:hypothetical protein
MPENPKPANTQDLLVRIWGMAEGKAFFQNVYARDLRDEGALLSGIEHPLKAEDVIGVQYGAKKARFRIRSAHDTGLLQKIQAEVELLQGQECPWKEMVWPGPAQISAPQEDGRSTKRQFPRHRLRFPIELRDERGGSAPMQTNASDISGRGCYVETLVPLPLGTHLAIMFWIDSEKITTSGLVRTSDPGVGMGIEFVGLDNPSRMRLQTFLSKLVAESETGKATS